MKVSERTGNLLGGIPESIPEEIEELILGAGQLTLKRILSKGQSTPEHEWYDQMENEWVLLIKGEAILAFEKEEDLYMQAGDFCFIPAHRKHRVKWTPDDHETVWLALYFPVEAA